MTPQSPAATPIGLADLPSRYTGAQQPTSLSADLALAELLAGNRRFHAGQPHYGHRVSAAAATSAGQSPYAAVVGCIDSRVPLEAVFDQNFGSITVVRSGGMVLDRAIVGSVEFAVAELGVPLVMVLGHERCGAVAATVEALRTGKVPTGPLGYLVESIAPSVVGAGLNEHDVATRALRLHVNRVVDMLCHEARLQAAISGPRGVRIVGAVYDLDTGMVELL